MTAEASIDAFVRLRDAYSRDPLAFVLDAFDPPPALSPDQLKLFAAVRAAVNGRGKRYISVVSGTGTGKSASLALLVLWAVATHGRAKIPCTATNFRQVQTILWPEMHRWFSALRPPWNELLRISATEVAQVGNEECFAYIKAAAEHNPQGFQGVHSQFVMFVFDEASGIPQSIFDAAEGSCSHVGASGVPGTALFLCTGNGNLASGPFYDTHHKNAAFWEHMSWSSRNSPFCGPDYIARQEAMFGRDSNQVRIRVDGLFPKDDPDTLVRHDWAAAALARTPEEVSEPPSVRKIGGLDPKGSGSDTIGFCVRQGRVVSGFEEWPSSFEEAQIAGRAVQLHKAGVFDELAVDCIGVGSGVCSMLEEAGVPVRRVNAGAAPVDPVRFARARDELWWRARDWFAEGLCRIDPGDTDASRAFAEKAGEELTTPKYAANSSGRIQVESKDSLKRSGRIGHSPGLADAFCLTFSTVPLVRPSRAYYADLALAASGSAYVW
ncbi:MAG: hypothetical protein IK066_04555 [Kiritimatiellae bacterium]|nr:hypothetical protein [Kiritimatiellia bacterium]